MSIYVVRLLLTCLLITTTSSLFSQSQPRKVVPRAKSAVPAATPAVPPSEPAPPASKPERTVVGDPGPAIAVAPAPAPLPAVIAFPMVRQESGIQTKLIDHPQKVMFVKSQATDAKTAIADLLLSDVGLNLITMALAPQMRMWNPYMNDSIRKGIDLGKGMLVGHGIDTKGFEYETLPGTTADVTLKEGGAEFLIPMSNFVPSADFDMASVQPVILKLEQREKDGARLLSSRQVLLKQNKTGRFDMKPTVDRQENGVEQRMIPVSVERLKDNIFKVTATERLATGEYALVFRKTAEGGAYTSNVALKPTPTAGPEPGMAGMPPGMTPEMMAAMGSPASGQAPPSRSPFGMLRRGNTPAPQPMQPAVQPGMAGFIAFDFRVMK